MNVRLVAYRKETTSSTSTTAYNLDLQESPNISINDQFSDIKEPETRKGSYSQTFKLPFTDNNNQFFQDWYNVNLDTLVFNTRTKFEALLYVGTTPQFEGALQLKAVYQKAKCYEVVLLSSSASLFSIIGEQRLKDIFKNTDGTYDASLNHQFFYTDSTNNTLYNSWISTLNNSAGTSLADADAGVSKVVYPMSITREGFYYNESDQLSDGTAVKRHLRMDQTEADSLVSSWGFETTWGATTPLAQFRPALQIRNIFKRILAKAGFSYTSAFIDGTGDYASEKYFGKLFMTTGNHLESLGLPTTTGFTATSGIMQVGNTLASQDAVYQFSVTSTTSGDSFTRSVTANNSNSPATGCSVPTDQDGLWQYTYSPNFTKATDTMTQVTIRHIPEFINIQGYLSNGGLYMPRITYYAVTVNEDLSVNYDDVIEGSETSWVITPTYWNAPSANPAEVLLENVIDISNADVGQKIMIRMRFSGLTVGTGGDPASIHMCKHTTLLSPDLDVMCGGEAYISLRCEWLPTDSALLGATIDIPSCIDPDLTQRDFLRDIIQRFNLVVLTDPDNDTNLIIEPYNDFIASGEIKDWTNKLDISKEVVVKDTTALQKTRLEFTDSEDDDLYNKSFKERYPEINVYGKQNVKDFNNDFAQGEMKIESVFSPYINSQVFVNQDESISTDLPNFTVQYEYSYEEVAQGVFENIIKKTKPKLFYYSGTPAQPIDGNQDNLTYYLHSSENETIVAYSFSRYPVCSAFDVQPTGTFTTYSLNSDTKSLYWGGATPIYGQLNIFNYDGYTGSWWKNALYGKYWKPYLDNIYNDEARIMECYFNLDEADIFNFSFADEIFVKDTYWRILTIQNYQVNGKASTKVVLIKVLDTLSPCNDCNYVISSVQGEEISNDSGGGILYTWCPEDNPNCVDLSANGWDYYTFADPECCQCNGGEIYWFESPYPNQEGLYPCFPNAGSKPIRYKNANSALAILNANNVKSLVRGKIQGLKTPLIRGVNNNKYSQSILPYFGDDIVIKYRNTQRGTPVLDGESHRIVLMGHTIGNTESYAYPEGNVMSSALGVPLNCNMVIRVKAVTTVIGGKSATYTRGTTDALSYFTAFVNKENVVTQIGATGGEVDFQLRQGANPVTCTLNIVNNANGALLFGIRDSQTDTKRVWTLTAEIQVNRVFNMDFPYDENWALFQNGANIEFENRDFLIWN
jgi:hypothetical protein